MNKLVQSIILFIILSLLLSSCEKSEYNDNEPPQINLIYMADTLYLDLSSSKFNRVNVDFSDNIALSSYNFYLKPDTSYFGKENKPILAPDGVDSLAYEGIIQSKLKVDIFNKKEATISTSIYGISSLFSIYDQVQNKKHTYSTRSGKYFLSIECLDIAGNSAREDVKSVYVLYPDTTLISNSKQ